MYNLLNMKYFTKYISFLWLLIGFLFETYTSQNIRIRIGGRGIPIPIMNYFLNQRDNEEPNQEDKIDNNQKEGESQQNGVNNAEEKDDKPTVTTNSFVVNTQSGPIRVTQVSVRRNLNSDRERQTPIRIIKNVDSYFDDVFNSFIGNMINMQQIHIINHFREQQRQREESLKQQQEASEIQPNQTLKEETGEIDTRLDEDKPGHQEPIKHTEHNDTEKPILDNPSSNETQSKEKRTTKQSSATKKTKAEEIISKAKIKEYQEKQRNKQKLFAQISKYVFYLIILFSFYVVIRKIFQLLDLIDANPKPVTETNEDKRPDKINEKKVEMIKTEKVY